MKRVVVLFLFVNLFVFGQNKPLAVGDTVPSFLMTIRNHGTQGYSMPYLNRVVLVHFYSTSVPKSMFFNRPYNRLSERYRNAIYKTCDGFEVIMVAVQSDKKAWMNTIYYDTLDCVDNGIALRGYNDEICKKLGINEIPTDLLIDEFGVVNAINPRITYIEDFLDSKKSYLPIKKDVIGTLAYSSNKSDVFSHSKLYLFNAYGDSIAQTITDEKGKFSFSDIKLNQDFILKVDNGANIMLADPVALYNDENQKVIEAQTSENGFVFYIPSNQSFKLTTLSDEHLMEGKVKKVDVTKHLTFTKDGKQLTAEDEKSINSILELLFKNDGLAIEIIGHAATNISAEEANAISEAYANSVKNYMLSKGVRIDRIKIDYKGNSEPYNDCHSGNACTDQEHLFNKRMEFKIY